METRHVPSLDRGVVLIWPPRGMLPESSGRFPSKRGALRGAFVTNMSKSTVFVVEDHQSVLDAVSALLATSGYGTQCYLSHEAFMSQHDMPEEGCILVDLTAPGVNGRQFMRRLRARGCNLPVIMSTFSATDEQIQEWLNIGVFAVLYKPFEPAAFLETIQDAMNVSLYFLICGSLTSLLLPF